MKSLLDVREIAFRNNIATKNPEARNNSESRFEEALQRKRLRKGGVTHKPGVERRDSIDNHGKEFKK